jgi:hypothetical protein
MGKDDAGSRFGTSSAKAQPIVESTSSVASRMSLCCDDLRRRFGRAVPHGAPPARFSDVQRQAVMARAQCKFFTGVARQRHRPGTFFGVQHRDRLEGEHLHDRNLLTE